MNFLRALLIFLLPSLTFAQDPGDQIFSENQVLTTDLQFSQPGFWDSLVLNYDTETYMKASVTITDNLGDTSYSEIGIRLKGNSSYGHPGEKKSFKIDFNRYIDTFEYDGIKKLNFNNCFKDPTFMREKIYYDICKSENINAPRINYANVYMNDIFWGFYTVVEQVDDEFLKTHFDDKSEKLFKAGDAFGMGGPSDEADLKYYGTDQLDYDGKYTLENNTDENNWSDLITLVDFINNSSDEVFVAELSEHFNVEQLMKSFALGNLFANLDSYLNSARNYYIYNKDSTGTWEWINWDCNEAFGSYPAGGAVTDMTELDPYYFGSNRPLLERIVSIDATKTIYEEYYCALRTSYFTDSYIQTQTDQLYTLIQPHVYADDNKMYTNSNFDTNIESDITVGGGPGGGTIYGLRSFISERNDWLDNVIDCSEITNNILENSETKIQIFPNPVQDILYFEYGELGDSPVVTIVNMQGITLFNMTMHESILNVSQLAAGMYVLRIETEGDPICKTFIKL